MTTYPGQVLINYISPLPGGQRQTVGYLNGVGFTVTHIVFVTGNHKFLVEDADGLRLRLATSEELRNVGLFPEAFNATSYAH